MYSPQDQMIGNGNVILHEFQIDAVFPIEFFIVDFAVRSPVILEDIKLNL
jgi:hypothetical protein